MSAKIAVKHFSLTALSAAALSTASILAFAPSSAHAEAAGEGQRTFVADSFGFGVEREMKASAADINIGVGELQECTISKSMDSSTPKLGQYAINGNSPGILEYGKDGAKGGNVEFEWKVEEGES